MPRLLPPTEPAELAAFIDHTLLRADATIADIENHCAEASKHQFCAVCVNPVFVLAASRFLKGQSVLIAAVVGFPLGANCTETKVAEARLAIQHGAREIDMVMNLGAAKAAHWSDVENDIRAVVIASAPGIVKVILETSLLSESEIRLACEASERAGAHFVKTSTGFLGRGASLRDVEIMRASISENMEVKASGGVKTFAGAVEMIQAGASRIGTSAGVVLVSGGISQTRY